MGDLSLEDESSAPPSKAVTRTAFTTAMEQSGALDFLTDALLNLYANPKPLPELYNFFLNIMGISEAIDIDKILAENQELRKTIAGLKQQIADLEARVRK
jgi:hypothetical protein